MGSSFLSVSFGTTISTKGAHLQKKKNMEKALLVLIMAFGLANAGMDMNKWVEHNKQIHFLHSCWGHKTMMNCRMTVEELKKECNQLQPAFDMSIFDMESDDDDDYFGIPTNTVQVQYPARFAYPSYPTSAYPSMPAHMPFQPTQGASSPLNAWMSFYSPYYNPSLVKRTKRAMKKPTAAEMRKFTEDMAMFKQQKMGMMGNLTCVLAKFGSLDSNLDINLSSYTEDMWKYFAEGEKPDPEFKETCRWIQNLLRVVSKNTPIIPRHERASLQKIWKAKNVFQMCSQNGNIDVCQEGHG